MRTSRAAKDTAKLWQALSPPRRTRNSARTGDALRSFAYDSSTTATETPVKEEPSDDESLSSVPTDALDMEDILEPPMKRPKNSTGTGKETSTRTPRKAITASTDKKPPKPARKSKPTSGAVQPPPNWEKIYNTVKKMRTDNPTAPVDTMGCSELYSRSSSPRDRRFQTLVALMLSSQTKDTVTAVAMERLHTELGQTPIDQVKSDPEVKQGPELKADPENDIKPIPSTLTLENILAVSPIHLNNLIHAVGFHNNKTKYIKATAAILRDQHDSDVPDSAEALMSLPGVGPKMAFLCMSAAWGVHEGIGVDVHVHRITNLWGWQKTASPEQTRAMLESWLPKDKWYEINHLLVGLGQTVCLPVKRRCGECYLAGTGLCKGEVKSASKPKKENNNNDKDR